MWEVVYPTSRAVELGAEDEEEEKCVVESFSSTIIRMSTDIITTCKLLVFSFDKIPTTFIEAHYINSEEQIVGVVSSGNEKSTNTLRQTASSDKTCFIYSGISGAANDVLFCQCKVDLPAEACYRWTKEVLSCIKAEEILILSTLPASVCSLNFDLDVESDHLLALKTDSWKLNIACSFLQSPNIVSNLPAAVLTHCQIFNIPAVMYVAVIGTDSVVDSNIVTMFNVLLDQEPLKHIPKRASADTAKFLKSVKIKCPHFDSNMYI